MQAVLLSLAIVAVGDQPALEPVPDQSKTVVQGDTYCEGAECGSAACGRCGGCRGHGSCWCCDWCGPMPQTCYAPRFGCYPGNSRLTHRYPAFHGYYYRAPYNYRHYFDYPWHAAPHEPMGFFSRPLPESTQEPGTETVPGSQPPIAPPLPPEPIQGRLQPLSPSVIWR